MKLFREVGGAFHCIMESGEDRNIFSIVNSPADNQWTCQEVDVVACKKLKYMPPTNSYGNVAEISFLGLCEDESNSKDIFNISSPLIPPPP